MRPKDQNKARIFLIDDHPIVLEGVRSFLVSRGVLVVGEASDAPEALRKVKNLKPDIIILEVTLPSMDGGELARSLRRLAPGVKLIAFSLHSGEEYVARMARCGVQGYVMKDQPTAELLEAVRRVYKGGLCFPANFAKYPARHSPASPE